MRQLNKRKSLTSFCVVYVNNIVYSQPQRQQHIFGTALHTHSEQVIMKHH